MIFTRPSRGTVAPAIGLSLFIVAAACAGALPEGPPAIPADRGETTVYLVRHAEKASDDSDPDLSQRGFVRADSLAWQLREAGVNVIITTHLRRTIQTAEPLARMRRITPRVVRAFSPTSEHVDSVTAAIRSYPGATILVVGHSNTIGRIAESLGGGRVGDLCDHEYSNLIIISMPRAKPTHMLIDRYGPPDPPAQDGCRRTMGR